MQRIGRYEVIRPLGRGGMGQVFLGRDPSLERDVALKLLVRETDPNARVLMQGEAKSLAALSHPNIVTIYEIGDDGGQQFIAMEYLPGKSLREMLQHDAPSRESLLAICAQVAMAVDAAHAAGILHRDIKPENVVVGKTIKVVDFGIARRMDRPSLPKLEQPARARATVIVDAFTRTLAPAGPDATLDTTPPAITSATQTMFGTPAYMAPEVLQGEASSEASDVYSLGVMLHECLTGRRPHDAPNLVEMIARAIGDDSPVPRIDDPLADLVAQTLDRDPAKRPSLAVVSRALGRQRSTIDALPPNRRLVVAGLAALAVAAAGFALWRRGSEPVAPIVDRGTLAIGSFELDVPSYGAEGPDAPAISRIVGDLIKDMGVTVVGSDVLRRNVTTDADLLWELAALKQGARFLATGKIVERDGKLTARLAITDLTTFDRAHRVSWREATSDTVELAAEIDYIALAIAREIRPGSQPLPATDPTRATAFLDEGRKRITQSELAIARANLDEAVHFDRESVDAWSELARVVTHLQAPDATITSAYEHAIGRTADPMRKRILKARAFNATGDFKAALAELQPFEHADLADPVKRDLLYEIGESYWHDGHHDVGYGYFKRALDLDPKFIEPARHAGEYALARRKLEAARFYIGVQHLPNDWVELAAGNYEKLANQSNQPEFRYWADLVLGRNVSSYNHDPASRIMDRLTEAAAAGDRTATADAVTELLAYLEPRPFNGASGGHLVNMAEVAIAAGDGDATHRILEVLRRRWAKYNFKRLSLLAAPLLGDAGIPDTQLTDRLRVTAAAVRAEVVGDRATAARLFKQLVDDPTWEWDYVERVALVRNLRALGRTKEADAVCADTLKPINLRYVFLVVRAYCRKR